MKVTILLILFPYMLIGQTALDAVETLINKKQFHHAEVSARQYLKEHPNDFKALELLGDAYGNQKKWDEAIQTYKLLVEAQPNRANYHYKYGGAMGMKALSVSKITALTLIGDVKAAFLKAAELDPKHMETRWALVELYMQLPSLLGGSQSKALEFADELEALSKVDGYLAKGYIYEYDKAVEQAEVYYKKAIDEGGSLTCFDKLTKLYEQESEPIKAIANIEEAQQKHNKNALYYEIGRIAAEHGAELQKGALCLRIYLKHYKSTDGIPKAWAHYRLAQIHMQLNNKKEALKYIDLALAELPETKSFLEEKERILEL